MDIKLKSTSKIVSMDGTPARVWEGQTKSGIPIHAFISRIAVDQDEDVSDFEAELQETQEPNITSLP